MGTTAVLALVTAAISTIQLLVATLCGALFDRIGKSFLKWHLLEIKQNDNYNIRCFFDDSPVGEMRKDDILLLSRGGGTAAATLAALLGIVVAAVLAMGAAFVARRNDIAVAALVLSVLSVVSLVGMLVVAVRGSMYEYRVGAAEGSGIRKFVNRRWWNTVTLYRDVGLLLGIAVIGVTAWLTL